MRKVADCTPSRHVTVGVLAARAHSCCTENIKYDEQQAEDYGYTTAYKNKANINLQKVIANEAKHV